MIVIDKRQVFSDSGKYIHKIGTDSYFKRAIVLPSQTIEEFEEVDEIPPYTKDDYDKKVAELVRERYTESEEFAIQRKAINASFSSAVDEKSMDEYREYNSFVEECKQRAKDPELYKTEENGEEE